MLHQEDCVTSHCVLNVYGSTWLDLQTFSDCLYRLYQDCGSRFHSKVTQPDSELIQTGTFNHKAAKSVLSSLFIYLFGQFVSVWIQRTASRHTCFILPAAPSLTLRERRKVMFGPWANACIRKSCFFIRHVERENSGSLKRHAATSMGSVVPHCKCSAEHRASPSVAFSHNRRSIFPCNHYLGMTEWKAFRFHFKHPASSV